MYDNIHQLNELQVLHIQYDTYCAIPAQIKSLYSPPELEREKAENWIYGLHTTGLFSDHHHHHWMMMMIIIPGVYFLLSTLVMWHHDVLAATRYLLVSKTCQVLGRLLIDW